MFSRNATTKILECLVLWCALLAVSTQGRSLQRIHRHRHHNVQVKNLMDLEMERKALLRLHEDAPSHHNRGRHHRYHDDSDEVASIDEETRSLRLLHEEQPHLQRLSSLRRRSHAINKRNNGPLPSQLYEPLTKAREARLLTGPEHKRNNSFDVELRRAENSSLCNYTVVDIPDESMDKSRTPKNLVNVMCNYAGSGCRHADSYCCIQTYNFIDVRYGNGTTNSIQIFTGCVCSHREHAKLKMNTERPPIYD